MGVMGSAGQPGSTAIMPRIPDRQRIEDDLRRRIALGEFPPGSKLPSHTELAALYGTSLTPVKAAIARLEVTGVVEGHPGKGVYVLPTV